MLRQKGPQVNMETGETMENQQEIDEYNLNYDMRYNENEEMLRQKGPQEIITQKRVDDMSYNQMVNDIEFVKFINKGRTHKIEPMAKNTAKYNKGEIVLKKGKSGGGGIENLQGLRTKYKEYLKSKL